LQYLLAAFGSLFPKSCCNIQAVEHNLQPVFMRKQTLLLCLQSTKSHEFTLNLYSTTKKKDKPHPKIVREVKRRNASLPLPCQAGISARLNEKQSYLKEAQEKLYVSLAVCLQEFHSIVSLEIPKNYQTVLHRHQVN